MPTWRRPIVDRALERGHQIELRGPSYRTRHPKRELTESADT
jgi:hypothetical protein